MRRDCRRAPKHFETRCGFTALKLRRQFPALEMWRLADLCCKSAGLVDPLRPPFDAFNREALEHWTRLGTLEYLDSIPLLPGQRPQRRVVPLPKSSHIV